LYGYISRLRAALAGADGVGVARPGRRTASPASLDRLGHLEHHAGHHRQALTLRPGLGNAAESAATLEHLSPHKIFERATRCEYYW
jgi:hypothetical protein